MITHINNNIFMIWFVFAKDFFVEDINAGLKDETETPEQLVSTLG